MSKNKGSAIYGAIEAGGTKFVVAVGNAAGVLATTTIPTGKPATTLPAAAQFLREQGEHRGGLSGIGVASFGPVNLNRRSPNYGCMEKTPKPHWSGVDMLAPLRPLGAPIALETDVNAAALGEALAGRGIGKRVVAYVTVGTGIGVGVAVDGKAHNGLSHPEIGHIPVPQDRTADPYPGHCPYHGNCLEGLACGPAIKARWGRSLSELEPEHPAYDLEAGYIATLCLSLMLSFSPDMILLGGGVMQAEGLLQRIRDQVFKGLGGYLSYASHREDLDAIIAEPQFTGHAAIIGCFLMAEASTHGPGSTRGSNK